MVTEIMSFGWYMRRTEDAERLARFYSDVLGLPLLRGHQPVFMFWAGETLVFELKSDEAPVNHRETDPETAPCVPVFRVHDLDKLLVRLAASKVKVVSDRQIENGREAHVLDTDQQLIGLREMRKTSPYANDAEAQRRNARAPTFESGCDTMPDDIQGLGWITCRYRNPEAIAAFYHNVVGLAPVDGQPERTSFDFGDSTVLEICAGGPDLALPNDRVEVTNSYILRLQQTGPFKERLELQSVPWPNPHIQWKRAHLAYFADPENHIVGVEERYDPSEYPPGVDAYPEDLEAERRYQERQTS